MFSSVSIGFPEVLPQFIPIRRFLPSFPPHESSSIRIHLPNRTVLKFKMKFDEFVIKLEEIKEDYYKTKGKELKTIDELDAFLVRKKLRTSGRRHLKSLKGLGF